MELLELLDKTSIMGILVNDIISRYHNSFFYPSAEAKHFHKSTFSGTLTSDEYHKRSEFNPGRVFNRTEVFDV